MPSRAISLDSYTSTNTTQATYVWSEPFTYRRVWGPEPNYPAVLSYKPKKANKHLTIIGGPCSIENEWQVKTVADVLRKNRVTWMRGGIYRAGTYGATSSGFCHDLLKMWARVAHGKGLQIAVEVIDLAFLGAISRHADAYQVGARQMQNYGLLKALARERKPVFIKRNMGATLHEFLGAAEYLLNGREKEVVLIERGSSTHMNHVRWDLSISLIAAVKQMTQIPILVDASHGTGRRDLVEAMTLAGVAAGADGFMVEVHPDPDKSISDADQAVNMESFEKLVAKARWLKRGMNAPV